MNLPVFYHWFHQSNMINPSKYLKEPNYKFQKKVFEKNIAVNVQFIVKMDLVLF